MATIEIAEATPMISPSMVRNERVSLRKSARAASGNACEIFMARPRRLGAAQPSPAGVIDAAIGDDSHDASLMEHGKVPTDEASVVPRGMFDASKSERIIFASIRSACRSAPQSRARSRNG